MINNSNIDTGVVSNIQAHIYTLLSFSLPIVLLLQFIDWIIVRMSLLLANVRCIKKAILPMLLQY